MNSMKRTVGMFVEKTKSNCINLNYIMKIMVETAPLFLVLTIAFSIISGVGNAAQSFLLSKIIDGILSFENFTILTIYATIIVLFQLLQKLQSRTLFALNRVVTEKISIKMEEHVLSLVGKISLSKMDEPRFLNRIEQACNLTKRTPNSVFMIIFGLLSLLAGTIGYVVLLGRINYIYVIVLFCCSILMFIANNRYEENVMDALFAMSPERRKMAYFSKLLTERESFEEIKTYSNAIPFFLESYQQNAKKQIDSSWRIFKQHTGFYGIAALIGYVGCGVVYVLIIMNTLSGNLSVGDMAMFLTACLGLQTALIELADGICSLPTQLETLTNYRELINELDQEVASNNEVCHDNSANKFFPVVSVNDLTFTYPNTNKQIINHASFTINPGECVALVGNNGSGKSTLVKLLAGLYDQYQGDIYIDGIERRKNRMSSQKSAIAIQFQNYLKPKMTVGEAIAYSHVSESNSADIYAALEKATYPIASLPEGLQTYLTKEFSPNGIIPSGGQWQKLALARMFFQNAKLYILDEPSAALDPHAEDEVFNLLKKMKGSNAVLFITHRLASVSVADRIIYLSPDGDTVEGSHGELMKTCPAYRELYEIQANKYQMERNSDNVGNSIN